MAPLTLTLKATPPERLDLSGLVPAALAGKSAAEIAALPIGTTRTGVAVGDVFAVSGDDGDVLVFDGGSERFDNLGRGLAGGEIRVTGDVGAYCGRAMKAGRITVEGSLRGPYAGTAMTGGTIAVAGNAADATAAAIPGAMHGMAGGLILIGGSAGDYLGDRMRRGVVAVVGTAGAVAGARMVGGTILAASLGPRAGRSMKRGTLIAGAVEALEPTFVPAGDYDHAFLKILNKWLHTEAGAAAAALVPLDARRWRGDMASLGKGEIIVGA
ncbi:formylmethanofuran dehydrogenase subunit C [Oharaeibacter diazotrophicus]|uniref:Formylmethanofuran dehydrogenase subunit C n=2 Tax=Oharaeibacter diazotrophicus TaxID=1920512 RepID=A0A4V3CWP1_9HYPH|nr:formylmethanofuran dehydrogenase subunit C [Oharaeibacter diazotrophicus]TDP87118.1 formylmethanofuran dehydrogenase subunit C [Oharaeibacter diazotrophicus]BBE70939.1 formylmethanofuran dehydrogenase [Pleomorphomonas sp. SM30]GLS77687.1 formylmethanofuran dehydrogenase subunit C [Oharaeibacter diazotrophicus]